MDCYKHFFYDFLKIQVTNYGSFEEMKKGTSAIHGATFFFYQKGHGAAPFYFSLDKTLSKQVTLYGPWPSFLYYNPIPSYIRTTSIKFVQNLQNCHKKLFHFTYLHQINVLSQYVHQFSYSLFIFMS